MAGLAATVREQHGRVGRIAGGRGGEAEAVAPVQFDHAGGGDGVAGGHAADPMAHDRSGLPAAIAPRSGVAATRSARMPA